MLERLNRIAMALAPLQRVCLAGVVLFCGVFALSVFDISIFAGDAYLLPALIGLFWLLSLYSFIVCFRSLPEPPTQTGLLTRLRARLQRLLYWSIALLLLGISVAVILLTVRFIRVDM